MHADDVDDDMSCGEKTISDHGPHGGLGISDAGRAGCFRIDEREDQSSELLDAVGVGGHHRDTGQKGGTDRRRVFDKNVGRRDQQDPIGLRYAVELRLD